MSSLILARASKEVKRYGFVIDVGSKHYRLLEVVQWVQTNAWSENFSSKAY